MNQSAANGDALSTWETAISCWDRDLLYRGYPLEELAESAAFLEVASLLICGELPADEQLADWQALMLDALALPPTIAAWLRRVPADAATHLVLTAALARLPLSDAGDFLAGDSAAEAFPRWLGFAAAVVAQHACRRQGREPGAARADLGFAANLWWMLHRTEPAPWAERALDVLLVVCAEHGFSPATRAVRMAAANGAGFPAAILAGLAVTSGARHTVVAGATLDVLAAVRTPDRAAGYVRQSAQREREIPGFVHRAYRTGDPRTDLIGPWCRRAAEQLQRVAREDLASAIEQAVWEQRQKLPSLIWPAARLADYLGFEQDLFAPLFVLGRSAGWAAHFAEQLVDAGGTNPRATYSGPPLRHLRAEDERS